MRLFKKLFKKGDGDLDVDLLKKYNEDVNGKNGIKIITLSTGETGTSTFFKQVRCCFESPLSEDECKLYKEIILDNVKANLRELLSYGEKNPETAALMKLSEQGKKYADRLNTWMDSPMTPVDSAELSACVKCLWNEALVQHAYTHREKMQFSDNVLTYFAEIDRISAPNYVPTLRDVMMCRIRTTGIIETKIFVNERHVTLYDVGGQRSERKKWIYIFEGVHVLLYFVSLSDFDLVLFEDHAVNRMHESLALWDTIVNSRWFSNTHVALIFVKRDLLAQRLAANANIKACFPEYSGPQTAPAFISYVQQQFLAKVLHKRPVRLYVINALDTEEVRKTVESIVEGHRYPPNDPQDKWTKDHMHLYKIEWNPNTHRCFPHHIQKQIVTLMIIATARDQVTRHLKYPQAHFCELPKEILFYIFQILVQLT